MNIEDSQDKTVSLSTGQRLREARERLGLSQQTVAERLCLKMSTVREIEDDNIPADLAPTFVRGYIRSYAKLVSLPADELLPTLVKSAPAKMINVQGQSFSLGKRRKKRDGWLMSFTWLVVFVVIGLTGAWWWQNHQAQQEEITTMGDHAAAQAVEQENEREAAVPLSENNTANSSAIVSDSTNTSASNNVVTGSAVVDNAASQLVSPSTQTLEPTVVAPSQASIPSVQPTASVTQDLLPTAQAAVSVTAEEANGLVMDFSGDCWLQVTDASGKSLFSGIQKSGTRLNLTGTAPFKLTIGAPAAVQVQFQGKPVDLSRFVKSNRVARLTLPE